MATGVTAIGDVDTEYVEAEPMEVRAEMKDDPRWTGTAYSDMEWRMRQP